MNDKQLGILLAADKGLIAREGKTERILELRVQAPAAPEGVSRPALNLAIVLDRSGSMQGLRLDYVKKAACHVLDQLDEGDQAAIVVYDDFVDTLAHSMKVSHGNRFELKRLINGIHSGSLTNLAGGWMTGCKEIANTMQEGMINRCLLLTDGLANVGETDLEVLGVHAFELYKDAVSTSTFGVGEGFNEHLLEAMANRGGGNFYYISEPTQIPEIFSKEFNDLAGITARKVELILDLPPAMEWKVFGGWSAEYKEGHLHIYIGDMLTGKLQDIYLRLQIPSSESAPSLELNARVFGKDNSGGLLESQAQISLQYATADEIDAMPEEKGLMERFSLVETADIATEALKLERRGERERASQAVQESLNRHHAHMPAAQAMYYQRTSDQMRGGLTEEERKQMHYDSYNLKRQKERDEDKPTEEPELDS